MGYRTAVIDSSTLEEANSDADQLDPATLALVQGLSADLAGAHPTTREAVRGPSASQLPSVQPGAGRHPGHRGAQPGVLVDHHDLVPRPAATGGSRIPAWYIYFPALVALVLGNAATLYMNLIALREDDRSDLLLAALTVPVFWLMMSVAAAKGCYQLIRNPSYWEKTFHGLTQRPDEAQTEPGRKP